MHSARGTLKKFEKMSNSFLEIITKVEEVTGTQEEFMLGTWLESAKALAKNADDFTKELYELNARGLSQHGEVSSRQTVEA